MKQAVSPVVMSSFRLGIVCKVSITLRDGASIYCVKLDQSSDNLL